MSGERWGPPPQRRKRPQAANQGRFRITGNSNDDGAQSIPSGPFVKPFDGSAATAAAFGGRPAARPMVASNWRAVPRNTLQGFFTLRPASGLVLHGCTLHQQGASPCVGLPGAPQLDADGRQRIDLTGTKLYAPVVEIAVKGACERFRTEETLSDTVRAKLETQTAVQANEEAQEDPVTIFVEAVPALLVAGRAHLTDKDGDRPCIADNTRWVRQPQTYNGLADFLEQTARLYRRALWVNAECQIEIWCEKDALAGVIAQGTMRYDVPLMVSRGFSSDTYLQSAAAAIETDGRPAFIYQFGDHEPSGVWIARSIEEGLRRQARPRFISGALLSLRTKSASATSRPAHPNERAIPTPAVSTVPASNSTLFRRNGCEPWCASVSNGMSTRISSPHCSNLADRFSEVVGRAGSRVASRNLRRTPPWRRAMTDGVTILHAHRRRLAKTINADGTIDPYDEAKTFDLIERPVADLAALASLLRDLQQQIHCCVVRGKAADPKRVKAVRRLLHRDAETGDEPTLIEVPRLWVALDVDGLARPEWIDPSDLLGCAAVAIRALPSAFQRAAYVVQATSGHGLMPGMRIRLWCWLSRPTSTSELKLWLRSAPVDPSVLGGAQIIYTAAPIIATGAYDPLTRRLDMVPGTDAVPVPEPALLCPARPRKRPSTRSDRKGNIAGLVRTVAHAGDHNRNNALYWAARRVAEDADIDARAAARQLEAAAIEAGLSAKEASATIKSALRHGAANG